MQDSEPSGFYFLLYYNFIEASCFSLDVFSESQ